MLFPNLRARPVSRRASVPIAKLAPGLAAKCARTSGSRRSSLHHVGHRDAGNPRMFDKSLEWWQKAANGCDESALRRAKF
jgi:hypothetical protein